ncbi:MAG: divalent-cation tolerance protein CutA [Spartobacteria bacterium]
MILFVVTTLPDEAVAAGIVRQLIEKKAAACGTIIPGARSIYRWKDAIEDSPEAIVIFKIPRSRADTFESELRALHPYETPEIAIFEPERVSQAYADWVLNSCSTS